jgi:cytoskeleton protein RodZ
MQATTFGERLKREREMRGVTLEEIAVATRISPRFLEALESEQWDQLPGGIFNRGFIRSIARFLGLDEEALVADYAFATQGQPEVAFHMESFEAKRRSRLASGLLFLGLAALVACGWLVFHRYDAILAPLLKSYSGSSAAENAPPAPAAVSTPEAPPATTAAAAPKTVASTSTGASVAVANQPSARTGILELRAEAGKPAQVKIVADGTTVFSGRLTPGQSQTFQARERFEVSASDSSAILLELNGQTVPPLGPPGQAGSITLTKNDLKKTQGVPH